MEHTARLSKLMRLSWEIQHRDRNRLSKKILRSKGKRSIRSLALKSAWTIVSTEDITVFHLVRRYSNEKHPNTVVPSGLSLFQSK
jgi:hypothetical protein